MFNKNTLVNSVAGMPITLHTDDNLTLAFEGMTESTPETLADAVHIKSLRQIARDSEDLDEQIKAIKAIAVLKTRNTPVQPVAA